MAKVPGSSGLPLLGDKSVDFYRNPVQFALKHMQSTKSRVFLTRFLNQPTVFVGCNITLKELLTDGAVYTDLGYKQFMGEIYGDNILFSDGDLAGELRSSLMQLFSLESLKSYQITIDRIVKERIQKLNSQQDVALYPFMKRLSTEICLSLFLGLDFQQASDAAEQIVALTTTHWHGIISVPLAIKLPLTGGSTFSKALDAKETLLRIICERKTDRGLGFPEKIQQCPHGTEEVFVNNHLLLFTSALVPKALSSILTSFIIEITAMEAEIQKQLLQDDEFLECVLLEVQRLYPPFLGGRRIAIKDFTLNGYHIPKGHALVYLSYHAHRDPRIFQFPDKFDPERWKSKNSRDKDKLFCFGAGPRGCIGQQLVWNIIKTVIREILQKYSIKFLEGQDLTHKWLPVSRPKSDILVKFTENL